MPPKCREERPRLRPFKALLEKTRSIADNIDQWRFGTGLLGNVHVNRQVREMMRAPFSFGPFVGAARCGLNLWRGEGHYPGIDHIRYVHKTRADNGNGPARFPVVGLMATSTDPRVALSYANKSRDEGKVLWRIRTNEGTDGSWPVPVFLNKLTGAVMRDLDDSNHGASMLNDKETVRYRFLLEMLVLCGSWLRIDDVIDVPPNPGEAFGEDEKRERNLFIRRLPGYIADVNYSTRLRQTLRMPFKIAKKEEYHTTRIGTVIKATLETPDDWMHAAERFYNSRLSREEIDACKRVVYAAAADPLVATLDRARGRLPLPDDLPFEGSGFWKTPSDRAPASSYRYRVGQWWMSFTPATSRLFAIASRCGVALPPDDPLSERTTETYEFDVPGKRGVIHFKFEDKPLATRMLLPAHTLGDAPNHGDASDDQFMRLFALYGRHIWTDAMKRDFSRSYARDMMTHWYSYRLVNPAAWNPRELVLTCTVAGEEAPVGTDCTGGFPSMLDAVRQRLAPDGEQGGEHGIFEGDTDRVLAAMAVWLVFQKRHSPKEAYWGFWFAARKNAPPEDTTLNNKLRASLRMSRVQMLDELADIATAGGAAGAQRGGIGAPSESWSSFAEAEDLSVSEEEICNLDLDPDEDAALDGPDEDAALEAPAATPPSQDVPDWSQIEANPYEMEQELSSLKPRPDAGTALAARMNRIDVRLGEYFRPSGVPPHVGNAAMDRIVEEARSLPMEEDFFEWAVASKPPPPPPRKYYEDSDEEEPHGDSGSELEYEGATDEDREDWDVVETDPDDDSDHGGDADGDSDMAGAPDEGPRLGDDPVEGGGAWYQTRSARRTAIAVCSAVTVLASVVPDVFRADR